MTDDTNLKKPTEFMTELWERVAARDAAHDARFAAIMTRKPARQRKIEPEQTWIAKHSPSGKKDSAAPSDKVGKGGPKKGGKANW